MEERGGYLEALPLGNIVKRPTTTILQTKPAECQSAATWIGDNEHRRMMNYGLPHSSTYSVTCQGHVLQHNVKVGLVCRLTRAIT